LFFHFGPRLALLAHSEISNLHLTFSVQENVIKLYISMSDMFRVNVLKPVNYLFEDLLGERLLEPSSLPHVV